MKIVTWNVNSINTRLEHLLHLLENTSPDVVLLQEIKCTEDKFPKTAIEDVGYNVAISGMQSYNGVAILSKFPIEDIVRYFPHENIAKHNELYQNQEKLNLEARYIEATIFLPNVGFRVASIYIPNGGVSAKEADLGLDIYATERFKYKEAFYKDFKKHCQTLISNGEKLIFGGDYNIAPQEIDVHNPKTCSKNIGFLPKEREILLDFMQIMPDVFRKQNEELNGFTWWDYRRQGFTANRGMRIDHILFSPNLIETVEKMNVLEEYRAFERPSDHAPLMATITL